MASRLIYLEVDDEITSAAATDPWFGSGTTRGRPPVWLAGRHVADQLPAVVTRRDGTRQAAVDRVGRFGDARAGGVGRTAGLRVRRGVRGGRRGRRRRGGGQPGATGAAVAGAAAAGVRSEPPPPAPDGTLGLVPGRRRSGRRERCRRDRPRTDPTRDDASPGAAAEYDPGHDDRHRRWWPPHPHALAHRWGDPRPRAPRRWRRRVRPSAVGHHRRHPATRAHHAAAPDGRRGSDRADPGRRSAGRPGRADLDPGRRRRHLRRDRQTGRIDQGDRRGPLREPRPDEHQSDRIGQHRQHRPGNPLPDARDRHRPARASLSG